MDIIRMGSVSPFQSDISGRGGEELAETYFVITEEVRGMCG